MNASIESIALEQARNWLIGSDKPLAGVAMEDRIFWFQDAGNRHIKAMIDIYYPGKWEAFYERTFQELVA